MANLRVGTGITFDGATGNFNALGIGTVRGAINATSGMNVGSAVTISSNGNIGMTGICTAGGGIHVGAAGTVSGLSRRTTHSAITLTNQSEVDWTGFGTLRRFDIMCNAVSVDGNSDWGVQLSSGGSMKTSGYNAGAGYIRSSSNVTSSTTSGFFTNGLGAAAYSCNGRFQFFRVGHQTGQKWWCMADISEYQTEDHWFVIFGYVTMSGAIDVIRMKPESGAFDSGEFRLITYED